MVDHGGNAEEYREAVNPGNVAEGGHPQALTARDVFWFRFVGQKDPAAQLPAAEGKAAGVEVGHAQKVGEHKVTVEAHEGAGVNGQRADPGDGGDDEHATADRAIGQEYPE